MSTAIVLPTLSAWAEAHVKALYQAKTVAQFDEAFEAFFAKDTSITINGVHLSRAAAKEKRLDFPFALETRPGVPSITFDKVVQVDKENGNNFKAGSLGLFFTVVFDGLFNVHGAPVQQKVTSSSNLVIEQDPSLHPPHEPLGIHGFFDPRRVSQMSQVAQTTTNN